MSSRLAVFVLALGLLLAPTAAGASPSAQAAATCSDYATQAEAQRAADTRDADGDGIYCESLPCPCLKPGQDEPKPPPASKPTTDCGRERWPVKTLSDPDAPKVKLTPRPTTIAALTRLRAPKIGSSTKRVRGVETTTYKVVARLVSYKREKDRDIHLVIADPATASTMIVEFPDPTCSAVRRSKQRARMSKARRAIEKACGTPSASAFRSLTGTATITGVGFFDELHGQRGVAPNGIELHPVISFTSSDCT